MKNKQIHSWRVAAAVLLLALPPLSAAAAEPYLVKDINQSTPSSIPSSGIAVGSMYYFNASDGTNGYELWRSDGTAAGTVMVKDIYPDTDSMGYANSSHPYSLTNVNGVLYFVANDGTHGEELWRSDGTAVGTVMVKDIYLGTHGMGENGMVANGSYPSHLTNVNGTLYFSASDGTNGEELWRSDGTAAGTVMVKDIYLGINSWGIANSSSLSLLTNVNGLLYFRADDGTHGPEVWRSDGTAAGTVIVKDIRAGADGSIPSPYYSYSLFNVNGLLYIRADDGTHGYEIWRSDGTEAGTVMVKDIWEGAVSSVPSSLTNINGVLYFVANEGTHGKELWRSDGTAAGTVMVKDIYSGEGGSWPGGLTNVNGVLYFVANDNDGGDHPPGDELWRSDGTEAGTVMVKDIWAGIDSSWPGGLTDVNGVLYFVANDGTHGDELWRSDGTEAGTVMIKDIRAGADGSEPSYLTNVNGLLYFEANDGTHGQKLWTYAPFSSRFTVTPSAGTGGSISPATPQMIDHGATTSFTVTPDEGYSIASVTGCGGTLDGSTYTTGAITTACTVTASFRETDGDSDGIGDLWEKFWFGDLATASASSDYDKDGYSDLQEYLNALAGQNDPAGSVYNPKVKNAPSSIGYSSSMGWLPAVKLLLKR